MAQEKLYIFIDGPRLNKAIDLDMNNSIRKILDKKVLDKNFETLYSSNNLGIRKAIPMAVKWVLSKNTAIIVLEDDTYPGPNFFPFMMKCLIEFKDQKNIASVTGYSNFKLRNENENLIISRATIYPESYAWATWKSKWSDYTDEIEILDIHNNLIQIQKIVSNLFCTLSWALNFRMTQKLYLDSWAYRWTASIWDKGKICIAPSENLIEYNGLKNRSHTLLKPKWKEMAVSQNTKTISLDTPTIEYEVDKFISRNYFNGSFIGFLEKVIGYFFYYMKSKSKKL
jgi:hypothetical protein